MATMVIIADPKPMAMRKDAVLQVGDEDNDADGDGANGQT